jgi:purine-nucleoside phosphorylase
MTNMAAGVLDQPLSGEEVIEAGKVAAPRFAALVKACLKQA